MRSLLLAVLCCTAIALPSLAQDAPPPIDTNTVLHPGDLVRVTVWRNVEMSGDFAVGQNGALLHPLYQAVPIAGVPLQEVDRRLRQFLTKYESDPQIVVIPLLHITIAGEVSKPSLYNLPRETSIGEAIATAGGPTEFGNLGKVLLFRGGKEYKIDLRSPLNAWATRPIESGDQIILTRRGSFWKDIFFPVIGLAGSAAAIINLTRTH
ncbi:MAG TPA: polysaccharide biosynthesis/export family protein [Gemmatimonadaceae bacterium]|nr:polysaccharide biosynthesis/export family protein [Gemmatimonadaceae bacterium]